jgi:hypothetical protein
MRKADKDHDSSPNNLHRGAPPKREIKVRKIIFADLSAHVMRPMRLKQGMYREVIHKD